MLTTDRLFLRELTPDDRALFLRMYTNEDLMSYIREPMSVQDADQMLTERLQPWRKRDTFWLTLVIESKASRESLGVIALRTDDLEANRAEVGYLLIEEHQGNGFATEALAALVEYAFLELNFQKLTATCVCENIASRRVLEKAGFRKEGHLSHHMRLGGIWMNCDLFGFVRPDGVEFDSVIARHLHLE